jgi:hypothetical protein
VSGERRYSPEPKHNGGELPFAATGAERQRGVSVANCFSYVLGGGISLGPDDQASILVITSPCTSVRRKSRPWKR